VTPERLLRDYFHAKDENRPHLLNDVFIEDARLEIRDRSGLTSFPAVTVGRDAIGDVLVRRFNQTYENIYSFYLSRPPADLLEFSCDWLVGMTEKATRLVRVGCGHYDWKFQPGPKQRVAQLVITIEAMLILPPPMANAVMSWLVELEYPWTSAASVSRSLSIPELRPIASHLAQRAGL